MKLEKGYFDEGILPRRPPFLIMSISNRGYSRTNLTRLDFLMYKNRWAKIINSPVQGNLVPREYFKLPHALESSDIWENVVEIEPILKSVEQYGENLLYVYAWHELSKTPKICRLNLKAILELDKEFQANKKGN
ncbi:MAG: hypothetical protein ISN29_00255 [Gammaproteobacteria bacterium AqS3]|nr:hypothetical protein [Gammaproteobacteria bacterium AqS3]